MNYELTAALRRKQQNAWDFVRAGKIRQWARMTNQTLPYVEHLERAKDALKCRHAFQVAYWQKLDECSRETFGKPWHDSMYKISCIGCEQFSEAGKESLRFLCSAINRESDRFCIHIAFLKAKDKNPLLAEYRNA